VAREGPTRQSMVIRILFMPLGDFWCCIGADNE
jgi:hypothetical protein